MQYSRHTQNVKTKTMRTKGGSHCIANSPVCPTPETPPRGSHYPAFVHIIPMQVYKVYQTHIGMCVTINYIYIIFKIFHKWFSATFGRST